MKAICSFVLALLALVACAPPPSIGAAPPVDLYKPGISSATDTRGKLVGHWYGEAPLKGGGHRQWLVARSADGTYKITFRLFPADQSVHESVEVGYWGAAGPVYFTMTRGWIENETFSPADTTDASLSDAYEIVSLSESAFSYRNLETGSSYTVRRVSESFAFPDRSR